MKKFLHNKGIPTTSFIKASDQDVSTVVEKLGLPLVAKERLSSGGRGVEFLTTEEQVQKCIGDQSLYFEKAISGTEGSIESFISDNKILFTSTTEYYKHGHCNKIPARYSKETLKDILSLNQKVISAMNIKWGMTHLEYYITSDNVLFGEVALRPPGGYLMDTLQLCYEENFWDKFVEVETGIKDISFNKLKNYSSSIIIYPSSGTVKEINGVDEVKKLQSYVKLKLNLKVGQEIGKREGVGQDYGHAFLSSHDAQELDKDVDNFYELLNIKSE